LYDELYHTIIIYPDFKDIFAIVKNIITSILFIILIIAGLFFRMNMFTGHITHVDSYKYLNQANSFQSSASKTYAEINTPVENKWGLPIFVSDINRVLGFDGDRLVKLFRYTNIILSLMAAILLFLFAKGISRIFTIPLFLSPLFFDYSSYIINEYLNVFLLITVLIMLVNFNNFKGRTKLLIPIFMGILLGFLPFVRPEAMVISAIIAGYIFAHEGRKKGIITSASIIVTIIVFYFSIAFHINNFSISKEILLFFAASIITGLATFIIMKKAKLAIPILISLITTLFPLMILISQTYKLAFDLDLMLFIFTSISLIVTAILVWGKKVKPPKETIIPALITLILGLFFFIFNKDIDRYAITIYASILITLTITYKDVILTGLYAKMKLFSIAVFVLILLAGSIWHIQIFRPRGEDYQQYVVKHLNISQEKVYLSGFLYTPFVFYKNSIPVIADEIQSGDIERSSLVIVDDSLLLTNKKLADEIGNSGNFKLLNTFAVPVVFNYSGGDVYYTGKVGIFLKI